MMMKTMMIMIDQASHLAFGLRNKKCPIQNLHQLSVPDWTGLGPAPHQTPHPTISHSPRYNSISGLVMIPFPVTFQRRDTEQTRSGSGPVF